MLHRRGVHMDPKPFSVGVRIEHPQGVIDRGARLFQFAIDHAAGLAEACACLFECRHDGGERIEQDCCLSEASE